MVNVNRFVRHLLCCFIASYN